MRRYPPVTSAEEPDGGNLHVRFRGGPRLGKPAWATQQRIRREQAGEEGAPSEAAHMNESQAMREGCRT